MLDGEVREKFKEFQAKTEKYEDLDIDEVRFEKKSLDKISLITMGQSPKGKYLNKRNKGIPFFQGKTDYGSIYLNKPTTWTLKSKKEAKINDILISLRAPAGCVNIANIDLSIGRGLASIRCNQNINLLYIFNFLKNNEMKISSENENGGFFSSMNKDYLYAIQIPIPKPLNKKYTSFKIQEAIVEFLEYSFEVQNEIKERIDKRYDIFKRLRKALIPSTFHRDYVKVSFGKYAKEKGIDFSIMDVEFEIKRIHSDNKDDLICKKRMGFTPKTNSLGDINWFSVKDLGEVNGLTINNPNSRKKTTMTLIKKSVDKNNTGKSEKLIPIKKNDILISFKLTVGVVKIYNSDKLLYCNEAIDILTVKNKIYSKYVAYNCMIEYPKYGTKTNNGITLNDDDKKKIKIFIPKPLGNYTSYEIQKIIADFIEDMDNKIQVEIDKMDKGYKALERLRTAYLARTFTLIDWGVK